MSINEQNHGKKSQLDKGQITLDVAFKNCPKKSENTVRKSDPIQDN